MSPKNGFVRETKIAQRLGAGFNEGNRNIQWLKLLGDQENLSNCLDGGLCKVHHFPWNLISVVMAFLVGKNSFCLIEQMADRSINSAI